MTNDWGPHTWKMLHTLAEKIKPDQFQEHKKGIWLNMIVNICLNLPCPVCAKHAKEFLNQVNYAHIKKKEDIKFILCSFHNAVNKRLNKDEFSYDKLEETYKSENTHQVIQQFINRYRHASSRGMAFNQSLMAKHALVSFENWYTHNNHVFMK